MTSATEGTRSAANFTDYLPRETWLAPDEPNSSSGHGLRAAYVARAVRLLLRCGSPTVRTRGQDCAKMATYARGPQLRAVTGLHQREAAPCRDPAGPARRGEEDAGLRRQPAGCPLRAGHLTTSFGDPDPGRDCTCGCYAGDRAATRRSRPERGQRAGPAWSLRAEHSRPVSPEEDPAGCRRRGGCDYRSCTPTLERAGDTMPNLEQTGLLPLRATSILDEIAAERTVARRA